MVEALQAPALKRACCATWTHPIARLLLGDQLHPGGARTTALTVSALGLHAGARVLDLGCGYGSALGLLSARGYVAIGLDLAPDAVADASRHGCVVVGDVEQPPVKERSLDGIVAECVLSLVPDKLGALSRAYRALRPGGRIAISDVTVEQPLPLEVEEVAAWSACVAGALSTAGYLRLLGEAGFAAVDDVCLDEAMVELIDQVRRRLALIEIALTAGPVDLASAGMDHERLERGRRLAAVALEVVRNGGAGYRLFHATKE